MLVNVIFPDESEHLYTIPTIKLQNYKPDEIFEKDLLMALPFFIMKYEKELQSIASNSDKKEVFLNEFRELMIRLKNSDIIIDSEPVYNDLVSLMKYVADYELENYADLQKEVDDIMGGKVLDLPSDKLREQFAEGMAEGELANALEVYKKCIDDGMSKEKALYFSGLPEDKIPKE